ncbi:MAG: DUF2267 domain-containing protein [Pseudaminobacter sp.]
MSAVGLESFERTVQLTHIWINDLDERLDWENKARSYRLLKAVLHAVRDWLQINEAADLGAQLPMLLRGAYYDQWQPARNPAKPRSKADFIDRVEESFGKDPLSDPDKAIAVVFNLLSTKVSAGEIEDVRQSLPADIRALWRNE